MQFLKDKGNSGVSLPHDIRLALSTLSLALGDLETDLRFIKKIIGGCPDFSAERTRYYLRQNEEKGAPWGCEALRKHVLKYFSDFEDGRCNCSLGPSFRSNDRSLEKTLSHTVRLPDGR